MIHDDGHWSAMTPFAMKRSTTMGVHLSLVFVTFVTVLWASRKPATGVQTPLLVATTGSTHASTYDVYRTDHAVRDIIPITAATI